MRAKELVLLALNKPDLLRLGRSLDLDVSSRDGVGDIQTAIERTSLPAILDELRVVDLRAILDFSGFPFRLGETKADLRWTVVKLLEDVRFREAADAFSDGDDDAWEGSEVREALAEQNLAVDDEDEDQDQDQEEDWEDDAAQFDFEEDEDDDCRGETYAAAFAAEFKRGAEQKARPYQSDAHQEVWRQLKPGARPLLHLATGGGKTFVANEIVHQWVRERGSAVLWVTKDWRLLHQAARDLCRRHGYLGDIGRLGGHGTVLHPLKAEGRAKVRYSTIQTLARRLDTGVFDGTGLVVWDECHWGEHGKAGRAIFKALSKRPIALLGLTATPRDESTSKFRRAYSKTFWELVNGDPPYLARPNLVEPIKTGVHWQGTRIAEGADFTKGSLQELAKNRKRNELIVREYSKNASNYGRTIVFACGKEHANVLANMFSAAGYAARSIHSDNADSENRGHLDEFKRSSVDIVVNVEMLTHGIDVPSARTVFLCRPTLSDILYSQMIGRASRLDKETNKTTFNVVEFTDNLDRFGDDLKTAKKFFSGASLSFASTPSTATRSEQGPAPGAPFHRYDPTGAPTWIPDTDAVPHAMRGLWFRKGQTFGFEIELTDPSVADPSRLHKTQRWRSAANAIREALAAAVPGGVARHVYEDYMGQGGDKSHEVWNVEYDASAGWEITSRVLEGEQGYGEVVRVADAIDRIAEGLGLKVNHRTGLHVHLAWNARRPEELRSFLRLARLFEPGLASLVPPSRVLSFSRGAYQRGEPNQYCRPLATVVKAAHLGSTFSVDRLRGLFADHDARYLTVNPTPLLRSDGSIPTIEIRMHSGTTEAKKMLLWLSLWQQILWAASTCVLVPEVADRSFLEPDADIVAMARAYLPSEAQSGQQTFLRKLRERRSEIVEIWQAIPELSRWAELAKRWG